LIQRDSLRDLGKHRHTLTEEALRSKVERSTMGFWIPIRMKDRNDRRWFQAEFSKDFARLLGQAPGESPRRGPSIEDVLAVMGDDQVLAALRSPVIDRPRPDPSALDWSLDPTNLEGPEGREWCALHIEGEPTSGLLPALRTDRLHSGDLPGLVPLSAGDGLHLRLFHTSASEGHVVVP